MNLTSGETVELAFVNFRVIATALIKRSRSTLIRRNERILLLRGEAPGLGEEVVVPREQFQHAIEVTSEQILPTYFRHAREVIDPLESLHVLGTFYADAQVGPIEIPAAVLRDLFHPELRGHASNHVVLAVARTDG